MGEECRCPERPLPGTTEAPRPKGLDPWSLDVAGL